MEKQPFNNTGAVQGQATNLPRVLGLFDVIGIVIGCVIGSGIFIVPAAIAAHVKSPWLIFAVWLVGGMLTLFGALSLSELGTAYPQAGGMYVFLREAYSPQIAFLFGWTLFLVIDSGSIATLASAFATKYLPYFFPLSKLEARLVAVAFIAFLVAVNYVGVRWGARLQNVLMIFKFGAILGVASIVLLFAKGHASHFVSPAPESFSPGLVGHFGLALMACLWAYKGWEAATFSSGEIRNPQRNLRLGLIIGAFLIIALYLVTNLAYLYAFPAAQIAGSGRIAADAMQAAIGPVGAGIIAFVILFSITGAANGNVLTAPRVFYAMASDGLFFKKIAAVHPRFLTPHVAIVAIGVWSIVLTLSGTFEQLFNYVVFGQWIFFGLTAAAVFILRRKKPDLPRPYKTWGYPWTTAIFILGAVLISLNAVINQFRNSLYGLLIIALGIPVFFYWQHRAARRAARG
jgi:basic amino acid/polyamine antiporter, APA family